MKTLQMFIFSVCLILGMRNTAAVVNNGATSKLSLESSNLASSSTSAETRDTSTKISTDSVASGSETEANKREAIIDFTDNFATAGVLNGIYGPPIDSYFPSISGLNVNLPLPVYGVPNVGQNIIYPAPPPDIPPPLPSVSLTYGVPSAGISTAIKDVYGPPKYTYAPIKSKPIRTKYGLPLLQRPPKPLISPSFHIPKTPKPIYGPPPRIIKPSFNKIPKLQYGPPKPQYGPPKLVYGPPRQVQIQTTTVYVPPGGGNLLSPPVNGIGLNPPPLTNINPININDGHIVQLPKQYGPPEPAVYGPPHPGIPAPPTPPDIKYDGWQPIPGLVSKLPSDTYGVPNQASHDVNDLQVNTDFIPPPVGDGAGIHSLGLQESYKGNGVVSDSYGAPLNIVTGSGGVVATSGEEHHQHGQSLNVATDNQLSNHQQEQHDHQSNLNLEVPGIEFGGQDNSLSVIKSVGYQLFPNYALGYTGAYLNGQGDTYGAPPANSYSQNGPYPSASYKSNALSSSLGLSYNSNSFGKEINLSPTGVGLIPPSGIYGITPSTQYGTPLYQSPNQHLNTFKVHSHRKPVVFREPVPVGLIQSIGHAVSQKDASGIIDTVHSNSIGPAYIPPPVPEIAKPVKEPEPSDLYSLPHIERPISFQNFVHGSSTAGLSHQFANGFNLNGGSGYSFGSIDGAYALPLQTTTVAFAGNHNHNHQNQYSEQSKQVSYNTVNNGFGYNSLSNIYGVPTPYPNTQHDCNVHSSQPLPQLSYGVPSANGYSASLSSLNTNIGEGYQHQNIAFGSSDLQASHSQSPISLSNYANTNGISEVSKDNYAKSLGESFLNGNELIKSQSLDLNNIPIQGALGTYTLQIQSADGLGATASSSGEVPHEQVLNDGLLQSILAAIEQPHPHQSVVQQVQADESQTYSQVANAPADLAQTSGNLGRSDAATEDSVKNSLIYTSSLDSTLETGNNSTSSQENHAENLGLVDNNEIALYFNNTRVLDNDQESEDDLDDVKNAQQYGSYVSFKTPSTSYAYGKREDNVEGENKPVEMNG